MKLRSLIPIAAVASAAALLLRRHRWLHDLHVALGVRALRLEGELARALSDIAQERQQSEALGGLAKVALRNEIFLGEQLKRTADLARALNLEVAALREMVVPGSPPVDEALLAAAKESLAWRFCGVCGTDRTEEGRPSATSMRRLQEAVERAERMRAGQAPTAPPSDEMAVDGVEEESITCCACDETRVPSAIARESGWRFVTQADGEPRWICGDCRRGETA